MTSRMTTVVFDASNAVELSRFWAGVLGWICKRPGDDGSIAVVPPDDWSSWILLFIPVPEGKTAKNRVHLDVNPIGIDQESELARLVELGATELDIGQGNARWKVLADPEGNEFCLLWRTVDA